MTSTDDTGTGGGRIEDRLQAAAAEVRATSDGVDTEAALAAVLRQRAPRRATPYVLGAAAAVAVLALTAALWPRGGHDVVADQSTTTAPPTTTVTPSTEVTSELVAGEYQSELAAGSLSYAGVSDALDDQAAAMLGSRYGQSLPIVDHGFDFDRWIVVGLTVPVDQACPDGPTRFDRRGDEVTPTFGPVGDPSRGCLTDTAPRTFFVQLLRSDLPEQFTLVLPSPQSGSTQERTLRIDLSAASATAFVDPTKTTDTTTTTTPEAPSDLEPPVAGREISFEAIGDLRLGQVVPRERVSTIGPDSECGYWPDGEVEHRADPPPTALVGRANTSQPTVSAVYLRNNPSYRTASGVGIGTSLTSLARVYGDRLVVDQADGWDRPTGGLLASYQTVAAVRDGDRAITYSLTSGPSRPWDPATATVDSIKVSAADFWGDDEGCA